MRAIAFHARLLTPASDHSAFEVAGQLAPYELQTLAMNAQNFPLGSRLEVVVEGDASAHVLRDVRQRLAILDTRGINVTLRRTDAPEARAILGAGAQESPTQESPWMNARSQSPDAARSGAPRILLAEDDPDMRRLLATSLRMAGHKVIEATDGIEVLDRMESAILHAGADQFDVIVSDVNMPGLSGLDVLATLRSTHWMTPVVLITAFGDEETRTEARELGAAAVLDKPLDPEVLRCAVRAAAMARSADTLAGGLAIA
jgi:CheY-like chemotaxis protein